LGSASIIVIDDSVSIPWLINKTIHFFKHESCGKCTFCGLSSGDRSLGQFVEGDPDKYWSGSYSKQRIVNNVTDIGPYNEANVCAKNGIFIGYGADECKHVGPDLIDILVYDTPFLAPLQDTDVEMPTDFPASPALL
jgi:hypothetical protein